MKIFKLVTFFIMISIVFCASQASAIDLYAFGSYWDKEDIDGDWGGGIGLSIPLFTDYLRLDGRAYYFGDSDVGNDDGSLQFIPLDLGLQVHIIPQGPVDPYVLGGVSYIYVDNSNWPDADSVFSGYVGAGLDVELGTSHVKVFGEALYRFAEVDGDWDDDIDVSGFTGNIGIKFNF